MSWGGMRACCAMDVEVRKRHCGADSLFSFLHRSWDWNSGVLSECLYPTEPACQAWICQKNFFFKKKICWCVLELVLSSFLYVA